MNKKYTLNYTGKFKKDLKQPVPPTRISPA